MSHLAADRNGTVGAEAGGSNDSPIRARGQTGVRLGDERDLRAGELSAGTGRQGRLVLGGWAQQSGEQVLPQVLSMGSMASGAAFHRA